MKNEMETRSIKFEGGEILGFKNDNGKIYMGIKKTCLDIGMTERQAKYQIKKIQENELLCEGVQNFVLVQTEGKRQVKREVLGIEEFYINAWLFKIELTPSFKKENPDANKKLLAYQKKATKILHEAFMATEEQKQEFYDEMGLKGEIVDLKNEVVTLSNRVDSLIDNSTINTRQAQKLLACARDKIRELLGDAHSINYKKYSRIYFKNLWNNFGDHFNVGTYKDLCPIHYDEGFDFINNWEYVA